MKVFRAIAAYIKKTDIVLLGLCLVLAVCSLMLLIGILNADYPAELRLTGRSLIMQGIATGLGIIIAILLSLIAYHYLLQAYKLHAGLAYFLTILTFFVGIAAVGREEAKQWLVIPGIDFMIQPAEFLKISFVLTMALHLTTVQKKINSPKTLALLCVHGAIPVLLIHFQGDDGSALLIAVIFVAMLFVAGLQWKYIVSFFAAVAVAIPILWNSPIIDNFQKQRIMALYNPTGEQAATFIYQQNQAKYAIANGGLLGQGLFSNSHIYVPEIHNDFIFAFVAEAWGFAGAAVISLILCVICIRILSNGNRSMDLQGRLICIGIFAMFGMQILTNIGMCLSLLPVIGNTLPFLSNGGSSMLANFIAVGLVLSVRYHTKDFMFD